VVQCRTHLDFVQTIREFGLSINSDGFSIITTFGSKRANILDCITWSYSIARAFNTNLGLRHQIFKHGWVNQLPNLLRQETISIETLLALLFSIMKHDPNEQIVDLIVKISQDVLSRFIEFQNEPAKYQRDLASWNPAVVFIFKELVLADWGHLKGAIPIFYKHALKIIMAERTSPVEFLEKVGKLVFDKNETV
jgi:brefeldin A-inhibited guanine nucleotide-exchange protein